MIEWSKEGSALIHRTQTIQANSVQPFEYALVFAVLRSAPVPLNKPLNFLESRDDALLAHRAPAFPFGYCVLGQFFSQLVQINHSAPRL